jgi:outer membrane lipase/esterase
VGRSLQCEPLGGHRIPHRPNHGSTSGSNPSLFLETGYYFFHPTRIRLLTALEQRRNSRYRLQSRARACCRNYAPACVQVNGFQESDAFAALGGFTALAFAAQTRKSAVAELGYKASINIGYWQPFAKLVWNHELDPNTDREVTAFLTTTTIAPGYSLPAVYFGENWGTASMPRLFAPPGFRLVERANKAIV